MQPPRFVAQTRAPSRTRAAMTRPSWVPKTTRPWETAGGISMRLRPGIRCTTRTGGRRPEATKRARAGDAPNIGQLASGIAFRLSAWALAGVTEPPANGPPSAARTGRKLSVSHANSAASPRCPRAARGRRSSGGALSRLANLVTPEPVTQRSATGLGGNRLCAGKARSKRVGAVDPRGRLEAHERVVRLLEQRGCLPSSTLLDQPLGVLEQGHGEPERDAVLAEAAAARPDL